MTHKTFNYVLRASIVMLLLLTAFAVQTFGQSKLVADETFIKQLKSSVKVETSNKIVFSMLCEAFATEGFKYSAVIKRDRSGVYTLYSIPFKTADVEKLNQFFTKINAKTK